MTAKINIRSCLIAFFSAGFLAFGMYNVHAVANITEGGVLGAVLLIQHWLGISPALSSLVLNGLCYLLGWRTFGKTFVVYSGAAAAGYSLFYFVCEQFPPLFPQIAELPLLASVVGSIFVGVGSGLCVRVGLELQEDMAEMAQRSVRLNGLEEKLRIRQGDIRQVRAEFPAESFRVVTTNPPYMKQHAGLHNQTDAVSLARHEISCRLRDVMEAAGYLLSSRGRFYMVHRPLRLTEIFEEMRRVRIEPKRLRFVHPYIDQEPTQVLIEGVRHGGTELRVLPPLVVYERPGVYTQELRQIYAAD